MPSQRNITINLKRQVTCYNRLKYIDAFFYRVQLMAYLILAAVAAAVQSGVISKFGQPELQWMKVCNLYGRFCNQVGEGIASSVIVSLGMIALSGISAFSLFRLYGKNGGKSNAR